MTLQIIRGLGPTQIIKTSPKYQIIRGETFQIIRAPSGPRGQAAQQGYGGWVWEGTLTGGDIVDGPPAAFPLTLNIAYAHSRSGFAADQVCTVEQVRFGSVISTASIPVTTTGNDWAVPITAIEIDTQDIVRAILWDPADGQCTDFSLSLGSTP